MARRKAKRITETYLRRVLSWYLERHDAPASHIRRLMMQRVLRAVRELEQDREEAEAHLDTVLADFVRMGLVDDRRWTENAIARWRQRGVSERQIRARAAAKGARRDLVDELLAASREEDEADPERLAALRYARRRRFGPWRRPDSPEDKRRKEMASMARAGFSFGLAREILDAEDREALEDELLDAGFY
jgi:regulatory protein